MSDLALSENNEQKTASEFHDDYITTGSKCENFVCPFCYIDLVAKAIYTDGPQGKSPHFSCYPKKPHVNGCDGYPLVDGKTVKEKKRNNKVRIGKEDFIFPEKLVPRRQSTKDKFVDDMEKIVDRSKENDIEKRRKKAGREIGSAKYTSSIIRSFASSKKKIISLVYAYARDQNLADNERRELIKSSLAQAPIELDGYRTNYQNAFRGTMYYSGAKKIWNGKGAVKVRGPVIYIISGQITKHETEDIEYELDFYIRIKIPDNLDDLLGIHRTHIDRLLLARQQNNAVKWSAYGLATLELEKNAVLLDLTDLDHFFVEKN